MKDKSRCGSDGMGKPGERVADPQHTRNEGQMTHSKVTTTRGQYTAEGADAGAGKDKG